MPLGLLLTPAYECGSLQVRVDDTLLLFTDGITESRRDGSLFGTEGICALWRDKPDADVRALTRRLCDASACYHDEGLAQDDRLALAARRRPARSRPRRPA